MWLLRERLSYFIEWNILRRVDSLICTPKNWSHSRAIMALDHYRLGLESKSGRVFCIWQVYFTKSCQQIWGCVNQPFILFIHHIWGEKVLWGISYLPTLLVFPGVSKFFIKSPDLPVRAPNLPHKMDFWAFLCFSLKFSPFFHKIRTFFIHCTVSGTFLHMFSQWQRLVHHYNDESAFLIPCTSCKTSYNVLRQFVCLRRGGGGEWGCWCCWHSGLGERVSRF